MRVKRCWPCVLRYGGIVFLFIAFFVLPAAARTVQGNAHIVDGDTLIIENIRIRLEGIDAPEKHQTCRDPRRNTTVPCGAMATQALENYVSGHVVTCRLLRQDRYNRYIGRCARGSRIDALASTPDLSAIMVLQGWALAFLAERRPDLLVAEQTARSQRRGIWAYVFEAPADVRGHAR